MDDNELAINEQDGEETILDTTPVSEEETSEDIPEPTVEPTGDTEEQRIETDGESKRSARARIREINQRAKAAEEKAKSLEARIAELTGSVNPSSGFDPRTADFNSPIVAPGEDIDAQEFERRVLARADARTELKIRQSEAISRIQRETSEVMGIFPELDPDSDNFNSELSESIAEAVEAHIKSNPYSASPKQFVSKMMKPYQRAVSKEVGKASENIARQVSQAALRPTAVRQVEKTAREKSIAELEAELGMVNS